MCPHTFKTRVLYRFVPSSLPRNPKIDPFFFKCKDGAWRARLVADGTGLENRKGFALLVGSNPTPSAPNPSVSDS